jgi:CheR methyltransferase, SAM binding domain
VQTAQREFEGEFDHVIFYALQSSRFTSLNKIEPARSAYEFVQSLEPIDQKKFLNGQKPDTQLITKIPNQVTLRLQDFTKALGKRNTDQRLNYFQKFIGKIIPKQKEILPALSLEYLRAMSFLYQKEFGAKEINNPQQLAQHVASLYQKRGHSTDTQIEANFAIHQALEAIKAIEPQREINRILIIGPGQDFAPRTDLMDAFEPQSYQPFAVADSLLGLKFSTVSSLQIHCVDINERVIDFLQNSSGSKLNLAIISGLSDQPTRPFSDEFKQYFQALGRNIGVESKLQAPSFLAKHLQKNLLINSEVTSRISVANLNIISERYSPSPEYDLVIITNVFPYFNEIELSLAITNISAMMKPGGYLLHNEERSSLQSFALLNEIPATQSRTALIAGQQQKSLFDGVVIHQKLMSKN